MPASPSPLDLRLLDSSFAVEAPDGVLAALARLLPRVPPEPSAQRVAVSGLSVFVTRGERRAAPSAADLLPELVACLNASALAHCVDLAVHAAVVSSGGAAVALPGVSGAGKSTLAAACLQAGWDYVSDEALVLDHALGVRPYPKPLALDHGSSALLGLPAPEGAERLVSAADLGAATAAAPLRLAHVVEPRRRPGPAVLEPSPRGDAAALLLRLSFNHYRDPARALRLTARAVAGAQTWTLGYDAPADGAAALRGLLTG
ncbi:MAG: hypothetical protein JWO60_1217 [Frankiales bacterium]|nr:hypothetical protein [Frankiales bacterium]